MNLHEYQAKEILKKYGIKVPAGAVAESSAEAGRIAHDLGGSRWMVKAQVHAGGRGRAGGVRSAGSIEEVTSRAAELLGKTLKTPQTGPAGKIVRKVLVEESLDIEREFYAGIALDRAAGRVSLMASGLGGVEIEEAVKDAPGKLVTVSVDPACGYSAYMGRKLAGRIGIDQVQEAGKIFGGLYELHIGCDSTLTEINPLASTPAGDLIALDAKMSLDDSALFRHPDLEGFRDPSQEAPLEAAAARHGLTYIGLDGNIGCLVNGAGLAIATLDILTLHGGRPANFLDAGGRATTETIAHAFKIILSESRVSAILINIFAGILRCDLIAQGVVKAARNAEKKIPIVVRLEGTNAELGKEILKSSGLAIIPAGDLADAAAKAVQAAGVTAPAPDHTTLRFSNDRVCKG